MVKTHLARLQEALHRQKEQIRKGKQENEQGSLCAFQVCLEAKITVGETRQVGRSHSGKGLYFVSKQRKAEKWPYYTEFTGRNQAEGNQVGRKKSVSVLGSCLFYPC